MAELCTVLGAAAAAGQIITTVWQTVNVLKDLRKQYKSAHRSIGLLLNRLTTVEFSLEYIRDWSDDEQVIAPDQIELRKHLGNAMEGCKVAMDALSEEVWSISSSIRADNLGFRDRAKFIWNESTMKDHEDILQRQIAHLQLMVCAVQCRTESERSQLFAKDESQSIMQEVKNDTASIRANTASAASTRAHSILSGGSASEDSRSYGFDADLMNSTPYQNAQTSRQLRNSPLNVDTKLQSLDDPALGNCDVNENESSKGPGNSDTTAEIPNKRVVKFISQQREAQQTSQSPVDEGYVTGSPTSGQTDLSWDDKATEEIFQPANVYRSPNARAAPQLLRNSSTRSLRPHTPERNQNLRTKLSRFSLRRKASLAPTSPQSTSGLERFGSRYKSMKGSQSNTHQSIDFSPEEALQTAKIIIAARSGDVAEIEKLLDRGADIEAIHDGTGRTALAIAAQCANDRTVHVLLQRGAQIDRKDKTGQTALHLASLRGHFDVMRLLIDDCAPIDARDFDGKTPVWLAASNGQLQAVDLLLDNRAKINTRSKDHFTPLHCAAMLGHTEMVSLIIDYGADIDARDSSSMAAIHHVSERGKEQIVEALVSKHNIEAPGKQGRTPLLYAAAAGHYRIVELLLHRGAKLKSKDQEGNDALHLASFYGHIDTVEMLLRHKLPINETNVNGQTALHAAIIAEHFDIVELLIRRKAALEQQCNEGYSPIHYACSSKSVDIVQILIDAGVKLEVRTTSHLATPLHIATLKGQTQIVKLLLKQRVELNCRDEVGERPLIIAAAKGYVDIADMLLKDGSPLQLKENGKERPFTDSPLCAAARDGHREVCALLVSNGASIRQRDEHNWTALRYAAHYGHPEVVQYLLSKGAEVSSDIYGLHGWELSGSKVRFASEVEIPEERKGRVLQLLLHAEEDERVARQSRPLEPDIQSISRPPYGGQPEGHTIRSNTFKDASTLIQRRSNEATPLEQSSQYAEQIYSKSPRRSPPSPESDSSGPSWTRKIVQKCGKGRLVEAYTCSELPYMYESRLPTIEEDEGQMCVSASDSITEKKSGLSSAYRRLFRRPKPTSSFNLVSMHSCQTAELDGTEQPEMFSTAKLNEQPQSLSTAKELEAAQIAWEAPSDPLESMSHEKNARRPTTFNRITPVTKDVISPAINDIRSPAMTETVSPMASDRSSQMISRTVKDETCQKKTENIYPKSSYSGYERCDRSLQNLHQQESESRLYCVAKPSSRDQHLNVSGRSSLKNSHSSNYQESSSAVGSHEYITQSPTPLVGDEQARDDQSVFEDLYTSYDPLETRMSCRLVNPFSWGWDINGYDLNYYDTETALVQNLQDEEVSDRDTRSSDESIKPTDEPPAYTPFLKNEGEFTTANVEHDEKKSGTANKDPMNSKNAQYCSDMPCLSNHPALKVAGDCFDETSTEESKAVSGGGSTRRSKVCLSPSRHSTTSSPIGSPPSESSPLASEQCGGGLLRDRPSYPSRTVQTLGDSLSRTRGDRLSHHFETAIPEHLSELPGSEVVVSELPGNPDPELSYDRVTSWI